MDRFTRKLSMSLARQTTRRDFLSGLARGAVGLGMGAAMLFGGQRAAFANSGCTDMEDTCGELCNINKPYYPGTVCVQTDMKLCSDPTIGERCGTTTDSPCPNGRRVKKYWKCCCAPDGVGYCYQCTKMVNNEAVYCKCPLNLIGEPCRQ